MVSVSNLFEAVVNFTSRAQKTFGVSPKMKQYLEGLKKEQENILGKPENKNINPFLLIHV